MAEALALALATPGLWVLIAASLVAGIVYGFAGFGAALVFMPVAAAIVPLPVAIAALSVSSAISVFTVLPRALGQVDRRAVAVMIGAATLAALAGIRVLAHADLTLLRWAVIAVTAATLVALVSGWRYRARPSLRTRALIGGASGLMGGAVGLLGPVIVLFQLAGPDGADRSRATTLVFLTLSSLLLLPLLGLQGLLTREAVVLGLLLLLPYGIGTRAGAALFRPEGERIYRRAACSIIAAAIVTGLPLGE